MMRTSTLLTPRDVPPDDLMNRSVVVFDVLRATTTITAALSAGVAEIRVFDSIDAASAAAAAHVDPRILCGERNCLPPPGFDLGNSPGGFKRELHGGQIAFMATTNGTRAIVAARSAKLLLAGALVNAAAVADRLFTAGSDVTLLCAGTAGEPAMEDLLGCGAVIDALSRLSKIEPSDDVSRIALRLFHSCKNDLRSALTEAEGGQNVLSVGLGADIDFAARVNVLRDVGLIKDHPLRVV